MRTINKTNTKKIIEQITSKRKSKVNIDKAFISSPSTLVNCACTDTPTGAFTAGGMINVIGDSSAGKTIFSIGVMAEACADSTFDDYRMIFDDAENANSFDISYLFGKKLANRIEAPRTDKEGNSLPSETIEDFHYNVMNALEHPKPCIYILDSLDAVDSVQDKEKIEEYREAHERGIKPKGSYGMAKPKKLSEILRGICSALSKTNSLLIIISQTRDETNVMKRTKNNRSGGRALKFYALHEIWMTMVGAIKSKDLLIGNKVRAKIAKNKETGKPREVDFSIYYDMGLDDIRSCIDFLVQQKVFKKISTTKINAVGLDVKGTTAKVIKHIESNNLEKRLIKLTGKSWLKREDSVKLNRKKRYK